MEKNLKEKNIILKYTSLIKLNSNSYLKENIKKEKNIKEKSMIIMIN